VLVTGPEGVAGGGVAVRGAGAPLPWVEDQVGVAVMSGPPGALGALGALGGADGVGADVAAGAGVGAGVGVEGALGAEGAEGALGAPGADPGRVSMCPRMSCFVTRPAIPVPGIWRMSTLCSAAILRTTGDERVWRSSSGVMSARGFSGAGAGAGADGGRDEASVAGAAFVAGGGVVAAAAGLGGAGAGGAGALGAGVDHAGADVA
jgi:hypothetical protein